MDGNVPFPWRFARFVQFRPFWHSISVCFDVLVGLHHYSSRTYRIRERGQLFWFYFGIVTWFVRLLLRIRPFSNCFDHFPAINNALMLFYIYVDWNWSERRLNVTSSMLSKTWERRAMRWSPVFNECSSSAIEWLCIGWSTQSLSFDDWIVLNAVVVIA